MELARRGTGDDELEALRKVLAALLEEVERLPGTRQWVQARYDVLFGALDLAVLDARLEARRLERIAETLRALVARGEAIGDAQYETATNAVDVEIAAWKQELTQRAAQLLASVALEEGSTPVPTELVARVKTLYRTLCRKLHPDAVGHESPAFRLHWDAVRRAYEAYDVERLEALALALDTGGDAPAADEDDERARLLGRIERWTTELARLQAEAPLCWAESMLDDEWVAAQRRERESLHAGWTARVATLGATVAELRFGLTEEA